MVAQKAREGESTLDKWIQMAWGQMTNFLRSHQTWCLSIWGYKTLGTVTHMIHDLPAFCLVKDLKDRLSI